jgi:hypothetical protein
MKNDQAPARRYSFQTPFDVPWPDSGRGEGTEQKSAREKREASAQAAADREAAKAKEANDARLTEIVNQAVKKAMAE